MVHQFQGLFILTFDLIVEILCHLGHFELHFIFVKLDFLIENVRDFLLLAPILFKFVIKSVDAEERYALLDFPYDIVDRKLAPFIREPLAFFKLSDDGSGLFTFSPNDHRPGHLGRRFLAAR